MRWASGSEVELEVLVELTPVSLEAHDRFTVACGERLQRRGSGCRSARAASGLWMRTTIVKSFSVVRTVWPLRSRYRYEIIPPSSGKIDVNVISIFCSPRRGTG